MSARAGVVYLVGAGPGDPGLMSVRSLELIAIADAIFYDRLIPPGALADVNRLGVGAMREQARVGQSVVDDRLRLFQ